MKQKDTTPAKCRHRWKLDTSVFVVNDCSYKLQRSCPVCGDVAHVLVPSAQLKSIPKSMWHLADADWLPGKVPAPPKFKPAHSYCSLCYPQPCSCCGP